MIGFLEEGFLRMRGLNDEDIALLNKEIPDIENLILVFQSHLEQINRVLQLLTIARKILASERATS